MKPALLARETLASVVVFLVALPLCMGIAIASGAPPAAGLVSGIVGGLVVGALAGSPLQVSGPAAGLAVIVYEIIQSYGIGGLAALTVVAGVIQIAAGALKVGGWFRAVAPAVIYGMLAGIGVLIFASQFHVMVDDAPGANGVINLLTIPLAVQKGLVPMDGSAHHLAALIGVISLGVLSGWNLLRPRLPLGLKTVPAPLLAVIVAAAVAQTLEMPIRYVEVPAELGSLFSLPSLGDFGLLLTPAALGSAVALAVIASAESMLCAAAVDKLHDGARTDFDRELIAQGVGNLTCGFVGGLPVTGVIVRSSANVEAGATTRASAVIHGAWLLLMIAALPWVLGLIPVASLAAILVYIGWKLVNPKIMRDLYSRGRAEFGIYVVTVVSIVATNLLTGLMIGVGLALLRLAWTFSHIGVRTEVKDERVDVWLEGAATFVCLPQLARALESLDPSAEVHIHLDRLSYIDHACLEWIADWERQRDSQGGTLVMEWEELESLYRVATRQKDSKAA